VPDLAEWDKRTKLGFEREMLGLYVSDHPLLGIEHIVRSNRDISIGELLSEDGPRDAQVTVCGLITNIARKQSKNGDIWAIVTVEDLENSVEVMTYSRVYQPLAMELMPDRLCKVIGRVRDRDESVDLVASAVSFPDTNEGADHAPVVISMPAVRCTPPVVKELKSVLENHPGITEVHLRLISDTSKVSVWRLDDALRVQAEGPLFADLKALLGAASVRV
jgi:DNA polymerase-3 subunit alpha